MTFFNGRLWDYIHCHQLKKWRLLKRVLEEYKVPRPSDIVDFCAGDPLAIRRQSRFVPADKPTRHGSRVVRVAAVLAQAAGVLIHQHNASAESPQLDPEDGPTMELEHYPDCRKQWGCSRSCRPNLWRCNRPRRWHNLCTDWRDCHGWARRDRATRDLDEIGLPPGPIPRAIPANVVATRHCHTKLRGGLQANRAAVVFCHQDVHRDHLLHDAAASPAGSGHGTKKWRMKKRQTLTA